MSADINLSHFTVIVQEDTETPASEPLADVDVLEVTLTAKERKTVNMIVTAVAFAENSFAGININHTAEACPIGHKSYHLQFFVFVAIERVTIVSRTTTAFYREAHLWS